MSTSLSAEEEAVVEHLAKAWNAFLGLQPVHVDDITEFRHAIHLCQKVIMARPVQREFNEDLRQEIRDAAVKSALLKNA